MGWVSEKTSAYEGRAVAVGKSVKTQKRGNSGRRKCVCLKVSGRESASRCWQRFGVLESLRHERKRSVVFAWSACHVCSEISRVRSPVKRTKKFEEKERENEKERVREGLDRELRCLPYMLGLPWKRSASPVADSELGISDIAPRCQGHQEKSVPCFPP